MNASQSLRSAVASSEVVVCVGTGGVGKTTTAAALAVQGARLGRRAVVVTIDPARRLGDALGVALGNAPTTVIGPWPGTLHALMLDTKATFDALVTRHAGDARQRDRILANPLYQTIAGALSGTQDYMAMEKLYELHESGAYDLIVIDTPPSQHALAFLESPALLTRLLNNRVYRILTAPKGLIRAVNSAAQVAVRQVTKVVGGTVVDDAVAFFRAFEGMEAGFTERAQRSIALLKSEASAFVLVTSPRDDAIGSALAFATQLDHAGVAVRACVCNRMAPRFGAIAPPLRATPHGQVLAQLRALALSEARLVRRLQAGLPTGVDLRRVAQLEADVHTVEGVARIADALFAPPKSAPRRTGR